MSTRQRIASEIRAEAARQGLSHGRLATGAGMSAMAFSDRINCKTDFRVTELYAIAAVLGVPVTTFLPDPECVA